MSDVKTILSDDERRERFPLGAQVRLADLDADPYPILARLRREEPVTWVPETQMWFLTRRAEIVDVLRDAGRFTTEAERSTIRDIFGDHMMTTDGEVALRHKRSCLHAFRAETLLRDMAPWAERKARMLVDDAIEASEEPSASVIEVMDDVATPLAVESALRVLGLPSELSARVALWFEDFALALANFAGDPAVRARGKAAASAFRETVLPRIAATRPDERGLLAQLAHREGDRLDDDEIVSNALIILFGGIETTTSMIGNTVWTLLATGAWEGFVSEPDQKNALIEEALRWQPAVQSITRHTTEPVELLGVTIPAGEVVQSMIGAANRDEAHFDAPDSFDAARVNAADHLSFGTGRHLCLGTHLARIEIGAVLDALRERAPSLSFADGEAPELRGYEFRRPPELRLRLGAERGRGIRWRGTQGR
jgi:cytochrome P450